MTEDKAFVEKLKSLSFNIPILKRSEGHRMTAKDMEIASHPDSTQRQICHDKIMFHHITKGKASDPKITRDVSAMHQERLIEGRNKWRNPILKRIKDKKAKIKAQSGLVV